MRVPWMPAWAAVLVLVGPGLALAQDPPEDPPPLPEPGPALVPPGGADPAGSETPGFPSGIGPTATSTGAINVSASMSPAALIAADAGVQARMEQNELGGDLAFGRIEEDFFAILNLRFNYDQDKWGIGVLAPLRIRLIDTGPDETNDLGGVLRREDWDEFSDVLRILRYVYLGQRDKKGPFYIRIGELRGLSVGHGTIVHRYTNGFNVDLFRIGTNVAFNAGAIGGEVVIGDVGRIDREPVVAGFRVTARPFQIARGAIGERRTGGLGQTRNLMAADRDRKPSADPEAEVKATIDAEVEDERDRSDDADHFLDRFVVGFSLMSDPSAPFELATGSELREVSCQDSDPACVMGRKQSTATVLQIDELDRPVVSRERAMMILGVDVGFELLRGKPFRIEPYIDFNKITVVDNGFGAHFGVLWGLEIPAIIDDLIVDLRTEYRRVSGDYVGPYFDTIYEIERYHRPIDGVPLGRSSKLRLLTDNQLSGRNGVFFDVVAGLPNWAFIGGEFVDYDGGQADGTLRLSAHVPALEFVRFSAYYYRVNISGASDLLAIDDRSALMAEVEVPYAFLTFRARWWRVWESTPDGPQAVDDWSLGAGASFTF